MVPPIDTLYFDRANDVGYIATVQVGTPPRDFSILMDSGSADFWIGAEGCQSQQGGGCVRAVTGRAAKSQFVLTLSHPRAITPFLAHNPRPVSKTPEIPSRSHTVLVRSRGTSSVITLTSLVWLWINMSLALLLWNLWTSPATRQHSMA